MIIQESSMSAVPSRLTSDTCFPSTTRYACYSSMLLRSWCWVMRQSCQIHQETRVCGTYAASFVFDVCLLCR